MYLCGEIIKIYGGILNTKFTSGGLPLENEQED